MKLSLASAILLLTISAVTAAGQSIPSYLIANDDQPPKISPSSTFFTITPEGLLQTPTRVSLGGVASGGGYFAAKRVSILSTSDTACAYLSLGASGAISAVDLQNLQVIGDFQTINKDSGLDNGIGLANNGSYLYASFSTSATLAAFRIQPGCGLQYMSEISPAGLQGGDVKGMATHGNLLVVAYGDGSIESFDISRGTPVSNGDLQNATGFASDNYPSGVDITQDGRFAIFGDDSNSTTIEISDISSGRLTRTHLHNLGATPNSNSVSLSPDESLLYIANNSSGRVTAAFFNKHTGGVSPGCTSPRLRGFDSNWIWLSSPVTQLNSGTGSILYLAEFGSQSGIAILNVTSNAGTCTLTEALRSPVITPNSVSLLSIGVYPPRQF